MMKYFDEYFDMVYLINLPERKDRLESAIKIFNSIGISKWKLIVPVDYNTIKNNFGLSKQAQSCMLSHLECYTDAINKNYERICIFEDDICFNISDSSIRENIENHLNVCFRFLKRNEWSLFYFDNIIAAEREGSCSMKNYTRLCKSNKLFELISGKGFTHSYAITLNTCIEMTNKIKLCMMNSNDHIDILLKKIPIKNKYLYSPGIFDQVIGDKSNIPW